MAASAAGLATAALRDLARLVPLDDDDSEAARDLAASIRLKLQEWRELPAFAAPDLQQLMDGQVRRSLSGKHNRVDILCLFAQTLPANTLACTVCASVMQVSEQLARMCSSIMQAGPRSLAACAASDMLKAFAVRIRCTDKPDPILISLHLRACRQLLQPGLLDGLSKVLTAAAEDLQAQQAQPRHGAARYWPVVPGPVEVAPSDLPMFQHQLLQHSYTMLAAWVTVFEFCKGAASRAASAAAALQLAAAVMDLVSQRIPQLLAADRKAVLQAVQSSSQRVQATVSGRASQLFDCVFSVYLAVERLASCATAEELPAMASMPVFTRLLTLASFINCQAMLLHVSAVCTAASSSGSSGSRSSGQGASARPAISMRQVRAAHKALSPCDTALLQLLGVSSEAAVWSAAALLSGHPDIHVAVHAPTLLLPTVLMGAAGPSQPQAQTAQQPLRQLTQQLLLLVPAMLLRWVVRATDITQQGAASADGSRQVHAVVQDTPLRGQSGVLTVAALKCILRWEKDTAGYTSAGASSSTTAGSAAAADSSSTAGSSSSSVWLQPYPPAEWLQQVFPDFHNICSVGVVQRESAAPLTWAAVVRLQAQLLSRAAEVSRTSNSSSTLPQSPAAVAPQPLCAALAAFQGVVLQTISSFDGFARSTAQRIAADPQAATVDARKAASSITSTCLSKDGSSRSGPLLALVQAAGPGSREQQALYSCLCSVAKLGAVGAACGEGKWGHLLFEVARGALLLLELQASGGAGQGSTSSSSSATAASSSTQSPGPAATPAAAVYLPSLVLVGRCFQSWAHQLQDIVPSLQQLHSTGVDPLQASRLRSELAPEQCPVTCVFFSPGPGPASGTRFERLVRQLLDWLADSSSMRQLAAAGHSVQQLPARLNHLLTACKEAQHSFSSAVSVETDRAGYSAQQLPARLQGLLAAYGHMLPAQVHAAVLSNGAASALLVYAAFQAGLEAAGAALTALATPAFCNNPACQNVSGPTELSLVSGRSCLCSGCCVARYCSRSCQCAQWAQHKPVCKALAAAATGTAAAATAEGVGGT
jgi:hypothetical protein